MSHTLHRQGRAADLRDDWIVLAMSARGVNRRGSAASLRRFLELSLAHHPVNSGDMTSGGALNQSREELLGRVTDNSVVHAVFARRRDVSTFLRALKKADLGLSVCVSGLLEDAARCARDSGLRAHTVSFSLGVWGKASRLPSPGVLRLGTMCGHGLVGPALVRRELRHVASGKKSPAEAAAALGRPCVCGVFNPQRAARILAELAGPVRRTRSGSVSPKRPG